MNILKLYAKRVAAGEALKKALEKMYPRDSEVVVRFNRRQKRLSNCKVIGCTENGYVTVRLIREVENPYKPYFIKDIFFQNVFARYRG